MVNSSATGCRRILFGLAASMVLNTACSAQDANAPAWKQEPFKIENVAPQVGWVANPPAVDQWKPVDQPDLAGQLQKAPNLELESVAPAPKSVRVNPMPYLVPNPDGKGWDMMYPYYNSYGGPQELVIHDFATGRTRKQMLSLGKKAADPMARPSLEFHMQPSFYTNGKLVFGVGVAGLDLGATFVVYDPAVDAVTHVLMPFGQSVKMGRCLLGDDGMIYGMGWPADKSGFVPFKFDPKTNTAQRYDTFGPANSHRTELYRDVKMSGDWFYGAFGNTPWHLVAFNFKTGEGRLLAVTQEVKGGNDIIKMNRVEGGMMGTIQKAASMTDVKDFDPKQFDFWLRDGKLLPRTGDIPPWSDKPARRESHPQFEWDRQYQTWPRDFVPPQRPLEKIAVNASDVAVMMKNAKVGEQAGWKVIEDKAAFGGAAVQADRAAKPGEAAGAATAEVTFAEPGTYYLYVRARAQDLDDNGDLRDNDTVQISRSGQGDKPFADGTVLMPASVRETYYEWFRPWAGDKENDSKFIYTVDEKAVGKPQTFHIATGDSGVTINCLLFSKDPKLTISDIPLVANDAADPDAGGHVVLSYNFQGLPPQKLEYDVKLYPGIVKEFLELNDHVLFATDSSYGQHVFYNLKTKQLIRTRSTLSPYSAGLYNGKLYVSGYPGSQMHEYDFSRPIGLDQAQPNPRDVGYLAKYSDTHSPVAGTFGGADGRVYNAGTGYGRKRDGGGMGWYDTKTGEIGGIPVDDHRFYWMTDASDGRYMLLSSKLGETGQLFCWDTQTHKFIYKKPVFETGRPGPVAEALPGLVIGHGHDNSNWLYGLNVATGEVVWRKAVPAKPVTDFKDIRWQRYAYRRGPDGFIWTYFDDVLVRIDPRDARVHVVGRVEKPGQLAFADGKVFIGGGADVRCIKGLRVSSDGLR